MEPGIRVSGYPESPEIESGKPGIRKYQVSKQRETEPGKPVNPRVSRISCVSGLDSEIFPAIMFTSNARDDDTTFEPVFPVYPVLTLENTREYYYP